MSRVDRRIRSGWAAPAAVSAAPVHGDALYAIVRSPGPLTIVSLPTSAGAVRTVDVLARSSAAFTRDAPVDAGRLVHVLKITGPAMNPTTVTPDGNPQP